MKTLMILMSLMPIISNIGTNEIDKINSLESEENYKSKKLFENKERYGGDMMGIVPKQKGTLHKASAGSNRLWPQGIAYYQCSTQFSEKEKSFIESSMRDIEAVSCVRFQKKTNQKDFINIIKGNGCYSYVGRIGGSQDASLGRGCLYRGTIIHELMHALGFYHEHMRSDRDQYLKIHRNHILKGMEANFEKNSPKVNRLLAPFDYDSIMIYSSTAFSRNGQMTMEPKDHHFHLKEPYDKNKMSPNDAITIKKLYNCP